MSWPSRWSTRREAAEKAEAYRLSVARHNAFMDARIQTLLLVRGQATVEWPAVRDVRELICAAGTIVLRHTNPLSLELDDICDPLISEISGLAQRLGMGTGLALDACQARVIAAELVPQLSGRRLRA